MSNNVKMEDLIIRYLSGDASGDELRQLEKWLDDSVEHEQRFMEIKKTYIEVQTHFDDSVDPELAYNKFLETIRNNGKRRFAPRISRAYPFLKYAAAVLILVATGFLAYMVGVQRAPIAPGEGLSIDVPYGGTSSVRLPDGSNVWLNAGSKLSYDQDFNSESRNVYLVGEALFTVEKKSIPFIVHTSHMNVYVTGTTFNVKSYPDEDRIETTVVEGEVRVETESGTSPIYIKSNQKLRYRKSLKHTELIPDVATAKTEKEQETGTGTKSMVLYKDVNVEEVISWQSGILYIEGEKLINLAKKLERKFDVKFQFEDEELKQYTYSGTILDFPIEQVLEAIKLTSPVDYEVHEKTVILSFNHQFRGNS